MVFRKIGSMPDKITGLFQSNVEQAFKSLEDGPFVKGAFHTVTRTNSSLFTINTGLDKTVQGWILVDTTVAVAFYRTLGPSDSQGGLSLTPSVSAGTYKFWVF